MDLQYLVNYTYDTCYNNHESCENEGICRCASIENLVVSGFKPDISIDDLRNITTCYHLSMKEYVGTPINMYCLSRFLRHSKLSFESKVCGGYYGQEVDSIDLTDSSKDKIMKFWLGLVQMKTNTEKIKNSLIFEYGYLLDRIADKEVKEGILNINAIEVPNKKYLKKVTESDNLYPSYSSGIQDDLPKLVCLKVNNEFRLIDGYNRYASLLNMFTKWKGEAKRGSGFGVSVLIFE